MFNPAVLDSLRSNTCTVLDCAALGIEPSVLEGPMKPVSALVALPDGKLASRFDDTIYIWNTTSKKVCQAWNVSANGGLAVLPDGTLASCQGHEISVWDVNLGEKFKVFARPSREIHREAPFLDKLMLGLMDCALGGPFVALPDQRLACVEWQPLISTSRICIWNTDSGERLRELRGHSEGIFALTAFPDGRLASGSRDKTICIWNTVSGEMLHTLGGHTDLVLALATFSNENLASGSKDTTIRIWNSYSGKILRVLSGHVAAVTSLAVLSDGKLASGSEDNKICIWNPSSGRLLLKFSGEGLSERFAALPDGRLASAGFGCIKIWPLVNEALFATLQAVLQGNTSLVKLKYKGADRFLSVEQKAWLKGVVERNMAASVGKAVDSDSSSDGFAGASTGAS